jgi:hypothetical protein
MSQKFPKTPTRFLVALAPLLLALAACGDSDGVSSVVVELLDEGKTVQDVIGEYGAGPQFHKPVPLWLSDMGGQNPAGAGETVRWESGLAAGEYVVTCTRRGNVWHGVGFTVVNG